MQEIILPWPLKELNPNSRAHWAVLAKAKKAYRATCYSLAKKAGVSISKEKVHLAMTFYMPDRRHRDLDNMLASMKSGLDGLADALEVNDKHFSISMGVSDEIGGMVKVVIS